MIRLQRISHQLYRVASVTRQQNAYALLERNTIPVTAGRLHSYQRVPVIGTQQHHGGLRQFCSQVAELSEAEYEAVAEETLDSLSEMFDDLQEDFDLAPEYDVTFSSGVLSVYISEAWGTIVINKQTPNKQMWLSSPISGPKRYDYIDGVWVYKHDGSVLHELLTKEVSEAMGHSIDFTQCACGKR